MDFYRDDWSPRSFTSASSSSPPSTPPLPLCSDSNAETDDTEDDIYSPICSDTECGDNDEDGTNLLVFYIVFHLFTCEVIQILCIKFV